MVTFFTGGVRSGKSMWAEQYAADLGGPVLYLATAEARDDEMRERIARHQARRPSTWTTREEPLAVASVLGEQPAGTVVLLDCLSLLVTNLLLAYEADPEPMVEKEIHALLATVWARKLRLIVVSNEVGMGIVPTYPLGRSYRDLLGWANQRIAGAAAETYLVVCGIVVDVGKLEAGWARKLRQGG
ncbi:bifunctional adenosylcobinamide kinase/adenosylcobinamide-phosphate guanylyltransferase [Candidatus Viridilinea mediisalina]|uniref:Adenosylcobinamide kinase n=1 Tax=Candidatus Viridilinea mediisalina TaxID=2024553 RepID=A0A2A6RN25_9CHLR|nr:bifunctional adenosylcobinamide kinase/adenosylcobinamide-phosphate guanylyltransferase [Candidatus Viridilinea mediisalina]PDW04353.1 bifunctional adenosylcobinamide kinase/adenosylcobinamide-phosphate guanylyltransferase [Candidatus Viridilinea mediisalina]